MGLRRCGTWHSLDGVGGTELDGCGHVAGVGDFELVEDEGTDDHLLQLPNY